MSYLRDELDFSTDREYLSGNDEALYRWNFQSGSEGFVGYPNTVDLLASAMRRCDFLKVFVAMGAYDMTCTADSILYTLGRLDVPLERLKENVTVRTYDGGHMMYTNPSAKAALKSDLDRFFGGR
jgi:carboxypeptidase C (cathepsin A)